MESYSLFELNEYVKRVIALNFAEPVWIHGEIGQVGLSRGNYYIDIIQKDEKSDAILAQSSAVLWYKSFLFVKKKIGTSIDILLQQGVEVKLKVQVEFHERYGFKLNVLDIDPNYTLGQLEILRQQNLKKLEDAGLIHLNEGLDLPVVLKKIAVISSSRAAGYKDFEEQLKNNEYGYRYKTSLFDCAVQGQNVKKEIPAALQAISDRAEDYDCVIIIRGGGSKMDLSGFDEYEIGKAIAICQVPVITGIGHEIDQSIADIVSHTSVKTPTAAAEFVIQRTMNFEAKMNGFAEKIMYLSKDKLNNQNQLIANIAFGIKQSTLSRTEYLVNQLDFDWKSLINQSSNRIERLNTRLENISKTLELLDPQETLKRGYSYISKGNESIKSINQLKENDLITLHLVDGNVDSQIIKKA